MHYRWIFRPSVLSLNTYLVCTYYTIYEISFMIKNALTRIWNMSKIYIYSWSHFLPLYLLTICAYVCRWVCVCVCVCVAGCVCMFTLHGEPLVHLIRYGDYVTWIIHQDPISTWWQLLTTWNLERLCQHGSQVWYKRLIVQMPVCACVWICFCTCAHTRSLHVWALPVWSVHVRVITSNLLPLCSTSDRDFDRRRRDDLYLIIYLYFVFYKNLYGSWPCSSIYCPQ